MNANWTNARTKRELLFAEWFLLKASIINCKNWRKFRTETINHVCSPSKQFFSLATDITLYQTNVSTHPFPSIRRSFAIFATATHRWMVIFHFSIFSRQHFTVLIIIDLFKLAWNLYSFLFHMWPLNVFGNPLSSAYPRIHSNRRLREKEIEPLTRANRDPANVRGVARRVLIVANNGFYKAAERAAKGRLNIMKSIPIGPKVRESLPVSFLYTFLGLCTSALRIRRARCDAASSSNARRLPTASSSLNHVNLEQSRATLHVWYSQKVAILNRLLNRASIKNAFQTLHVIRCARRIKYVIN